MRNVAICLFLAVQVAQAINIVSNVPTTWIDCTIVRTNGYFEGGAIFDLEAKKQIIVTNVFETDVIIDE